MIDCLQILHWPGSTDALCSEVQDDEGKLIGATVHDLLSGKKHNVHAHIVINATGPFADNVRHLSDPNAPKMIMPSAGVHVTLPDYYSPENIGMIIPKTKDGRVVFMLPWLGATIAGTTGDPLLLQFRSCTSDNSALVFILVHLESASSSRESLMQWSVSSRYSRE